MHSRPYTALSTSRSIFCQSARLWTAGGAGIGLAGGSANSDHGEE